MRDGKGNKMTVNVTDDQMDTLSVQQAEDGLTVHKEDLCQSDTPTAHMHMDYFSSAAAVMTSIRIAKEHSKLYV